LQRSREDLVVAFDRTGRATEAERMRAEMGSSQPAGH
jgi:hypothetical protein